jgi:hypothetical protein
MLKCTFRVFALFVLTTSTAFCQTPLKVDSKAFLVPTGIFVSAGQTVTITVSGTVTISAGSGFLTTNDEGVIQTAPDSGTGTYNFFTNAPPPLEPPAPGKIKFTQGGPGGIAGAYGSLVVATSTKQCNATSTSDFPDAFVVTESEGGLLTFPAGYLYLAVVKDNNVTISGTYATTISLAGQAKPPLGCTGGPVETLDPVPTLLIPTTSAITTNTAALAGGGTVVTGVAADGVAQVLIRAHGVDPTHVNVVVVVDENGQTAPANGEDGTLVSPFGGIVPAGIAVIPAIQNVNGINYIFVTYQPPIDYARASGGDNATSSRKLGIVVFDTNTSTAVGAATLSLLRPPVFFVHGLWGAPSTWNQFDVALTGALPGLDTYRADFAADNGKSVGYNTPNILLQAYNSLYAFRRKENAAAAQLDFIVHSMGGLISDTMPTLPLFRTPLSYGHGIIHKLITIDTPYEGSPLAVGVTDSGPYCWALLKLAGADVDGAIADLIPGSPFLKAFNTSPPGYSKHAIASFVTAGQATGAELIVNALFAAASKVNGASQIADVCEPVFVNSADVGPPSFTFQNYFQTPLDPYAGANDLVVSERSQLSTQYTPGTTADVTSGLAHSNIPIPFLNISIPGSLDAGVGDPESNNMNALRLLNSPAKGGLFVQ